LSKSVDIDVAIAMLLGPLFYRHIMSMVDRSIPSHLPEAIVESFLKSQGFDVQHAPAPRQTPIPRGSRRRRGLPLRAEK
jgi:hypothetical protein